MNKKPTLTNILRLMASMRPAPSGIYTLYALNKEIGLCRGRLIPKSGERFATLNSKDINEGPTTHHWNQIDDSIRILKKRGIF